MDEELQKRSTDCVYFLASPLTCKKGIECEYRHNEVARLNPRDCWYWLAGSCLNPSCAFRHPPLDLPIKVSSKSAPPPHYQSSVPPANKLNTSCYFYFNGFCNKGDRCPFLHGPYEDVKPALKPTKTVSAVTGAPPPLENKTSTPIKAPSEADSKRVAELLIRPKPDVHLSAPTPTKVDDETVSPHMSPASECKEAASEMLLLGTNLVQTRSLVCTDRILEDDGVDSDLDREDCLESSPGLDVLVDDDRLQNLGYEEDPEYMRSIDRDGGELHGRFSGYDYEDQVNTTHLFYEHDRYDSFDQFDRSERFDSTREFHGHSRERMLEQILSGKKRKSFSVNLGTDDERGAADLRNNFKKRRRVARLSKRNNVSFVVDGIRKRSQKLGTPWLYGRLNSEVHSDGVGSFSKNRNLLCPNRSRRQRREKFLPSGSRKGRSTEDNCTVFTGPKSLAQIRYEKAKAKEDGDSSCRPRNSSRTTSQQFQGPKPLSEILKERKKLRSVIDAENYSSENSRALGFQAE